MKAVCGRCGTFKETAWKRCTQCNYRPVGDEEKAQHLLLSTHCNTAAKLQQFSEHIKSGKSIEFKDKELALVTEILKKKYQSEKSQRAYMLKLIGCFLLTILLMVGFYFLKAT